MGPGSSEGWCHSGHEACSQCTLTTIRHLPPSIGIPEKLVVFETRKITQVIPEQTKQYTSLDEVQQHFSCLSGSAVVFATSFLCSLGLGSDNSQCQPFLPETPSLLPFQGSWCSNQITGKMGTWVIFSAKLPILQKL